MNLAQIASPPATSDRRIRRFTEIPSPHDVLTEFPLGARRAAATRDYLISQGVAGNRLKTVSYGKERPVAVCDDISCWSQNRRAVTVPQGAGS